MVLDCGLALEAGIRTSGSADDDDDDSDESEGDGSCDDAVTEHSPGVATALCYNTRITTTTTVTVNTLR